MSLNSQDLIASGAFKRETLKIAKSKLGFSDYTLFGEIPQWTGRIRGEIVVAVTKKFKEW